MSQPILGTFTADGESPSFTCRQFTILLGNTTTTNFGGGTVTVLVSHDGENFTADATTYTAGDVINSVAYAKGLVVKLSLAGSTSPDLAYSIVYE